jgi:hypothetical protein
MMLRKVPIKLSVERHGDWRSSGAGEAHVTSLLADDGVTELGKRRDAGAA